MTIQLMRVEAGVDSALVNSSVVCRRIGYTQWLRGEGHTADVVVWNNNLILPAGARAKTPRARLLVNWGTGDSNIRHWQEWSGVRLVTTGGYCTQAVRDFVLDRISRHAPVGPGSIVGLIGMGRIGYAIALAVGPHVAQVVYNARQARPGLPFQPLPVEDVLRSADVIVVAANTRDRLDLSGLHENRRRPFIVTVSPDEVLPVAEVAELVCDGHVRGIVSDNPTPHDRPDLAPFYTGKVSAVKASPAAVGSRSTPVVAPSGTTDDPVRALQHALYRTAKADPGRRFHALRDKIFRRDVLWRAWVAVRRNDGAPGIDKITLAEVEEYGVARLLDELASELREQVYRPMPTRRVWIPKPGRPSEQRPLSIPRGA